MEGGTPSSRRVWCELYYTPPGCLIPGGNGLVAGRSVCEEVEVSATPVPTRSNNAERAAWHWNLEGPPSGTPVAPEEMPRVECFLAEGCPELREAWWVPLRVPEIGPGARHKIHLTHRSHWVVVSGGVGTAVTDQHGEPIWERAGVFVERPIPGTDDLIVAGGGSDDFCVDSIATISWVGRIDERGELVWVHHVDRDRTLDWWVAPDGRSLWSLVNRDGDGGSACWQDMADWWGIRIQDAETGRGSACAEFVEALPVQYELPYRLFSQIFTGSFAGHRFLSYNDGNAIRFDLPTGQMEQVRLQGPPGVDMRAHTLDRGLGQPVVLGDGSTILVSTHGMHRLNPDWTLRDEDWWITEPDGEDVWATEMEWQSSSVVMNIDGTMYLGGQRYRYPPLFPDDPTAGWENMQAAMIRIWGTAAVAEDGTSIIAGSVETRAYTPDWSRMLWRIVGPAGDGPTPAPFVIDGPPIILDNGDMIFSDYEGRVMVLSTVHGGLARTPAPTLGFDNQRSGILPTGPFQTEPIPRRWRWPEGVDGSGE